jgi:hypothetical protein
MTWCTATEYRYRLHNAVDVDNEKDYKCMVTNLLEQKLKKVKIMDDMKDV